jgi:hypothetical protein
MLRMIGYLFFFSLISFSIAPDPTEEPSRELSITFVDTIDWSFRDQQMQKIIKYLNNAPATIGFSLNATIPPSIRTRTVTFWDTPNKDLEAADRLIRTRWDFPSNNFSQLTYKISYPFKQYSCSRNVYPTPPYEKTSKCKCEQEIGYVLFVFCHLFLCLLCLCLFDFVCGCVRLFFCLFLLLFGLFYVCSFVFLLGGSL